jgi:hypothetical protein
VPGRLIVSAARDGDVVDDDIMLVRGGELDPDVLRAMTLCLRLFCVP